MKTPKRMFSLFGSFLRTKKRRTGRRTGRRNPRKKRATRRHVMKGG